jgi:hypothetical protein
MTNYTNVPNQLFADLSEGKLTIRMFLIMLWLRHRAKYSTGVAQHVTSKKIQSALWTDEGDDKAPSIRTIQKDLKLMRLCGYIRSDHELGSRRSYAVTINNYITQVTAPDGSQRELTLNPTEPLDYRDLPANKVAEKDGEDSVSGRSEVEDESETLPRISLSSLPTLASLRSFKDSVSESESVCAGGAAEALASSGDSVERVTLPLSSDEKLGIPVQESSAQPTPSSSSEAPLHWNPVHQIEASSSAHELCREWIRIREEVWKEEASHADSMTEWFEVLLQSHPFHDIWAVLSWLPRSDYWGKPGKGHFDGIEGFVCAFETLLKQSSKFRSALIKAKSSGKKPAKQGSTSLDICPYCGKLAAKLFHTCPEKDKAAKKAFFGVEEAE